MNFLEIFRHGKHVLDIRKGEELPELITFPERRRRMREIARRFLEGQISYETSDVLRRELYDPRRVCISSPNDTRVATRAPWEK